MDSIAIVGAGGHGREVLMLIDHLNRAGQRWKVEGFFDDAVPRGTVVNGSPVLGDLDVLNRYERRLAVVLGIGMPQVRQHVLGRIDSRNIWFPSLIHPTVQLPGGDLVKVGQGVTLLAGVIVGPNVSFDDYVMLNTGVIVGHDSQIGRTTCVMPAVAISGEVTIGQGVYIGVGASIINRIEVGDGTVVSAGSVVFSSLPKHVTAMGMPARIVRRNEETRLA